MNIENFTPTMERVIRLAEIEAQKDKSCLGVSHVLIGMMLEGNNFASMLLGDSGFTVEGLRKGQRTISNQS